VTSPADLDAVRKLYARLLDAWNRRDAQDYAALVAKDGVVIGFDGSQMAGSEVEQELSPIFADHPTAAYVAKVREVKPVGDGAVLLRAIVGMVPPGHDDLKSDVNALQSLVAEQRDGDWRIVLFQNTPARYDGRPELVEQHTASCVSC
jgi:uncharacterized protein (TIGR02246 family)